MRIAFVEMPGRGKLDRLLADWAAALLARGIQVHGVVKVLDQVDQGLRQPEQDCAHRCDMELQVLPVGTRIWLSQNLGPGSRGCRIDPAAMERAASAIECSLSPAAEVLVINKFGKFEARWRGFCRAMALAAELDVPIVCGVTPISAAAFATFTEGQAVQIAPRLEDLDAWLLNVRPALISSQLARA